MPTHLHRVNLSLPADVVSVLDRMGKVTGAGRATIIREWLQEAVPQLITLAQALELAAAKNIDAWDVMASAVSKLTAESGQLELNVKRDRRAAMRKRKK